MRLNYILTDPSFFSNEGRSGQVSHALGIIKGLQSNNVDLTVISEKNIERFLENPIEGVTLEQVEKKGNNVINNIMFALDCLKNAKKNGHDILIRKNLVTLLIYSFTFNFTLLGIDSRVFWEINGLSLQKFQKNKIIYFFYLLVLILHKFILRYSAGIYVVSDSLKEKLTTGSLTIDPENIKVISNGAPSWLGPSYNKDKKPFKFIYFGVFQPYNDFKLVIEAFKRVEMSINDDIELHFIGFGKEAELLNKASSEIKNIYRWEPKAPFDLHHEGIATFQSVGLIPLKKIANSKFLSPVKLFDYTALGMPIIISDTAKIKRYSNIEKLLFSYKAEDISSLTQVMIDLINKKQVWKKIDLLTKKATENNSWSERMKQLKLFIESR